MLDDLLDAPISLAHAAQFSPLTLAFIGDAVYELLVRGQVLARGSAPVGKLHHRTVDFVRADAQAKAVRAIQPILTETEATILRRGRNANSAHIAKNADPVDYRYATGLESLFGYLYLTGKNQRLRELFALIVQEKEAAAGQSES